jgi:hypothetical protein
MIVSLVDKILAHQKLFEKDLDDNYVIRRPEDRNILANDNKLIKMIKISK